MGNHVAVAGVSGMLVVLPVGRVDVNFDVTLDAAQSRLDQEGCPAEIRASLPVPASGVLHGDLFAVARLQGSGSERRVVPDALDVTFAEVAQGSITQEPGAGGAKRMPVRGGLWKQGSGALVVVWHAGMIGPLASPTKHYPGHFHRLTGILRFTKALDTCILP